MKYINPGFIALVDADDDCAEITKNNQLALQSTFNISLPTINTADIYYKFQFYYESGYDLSIKVKFLDDVLQIKCSDYSQRIIYDYIYEYGTSSGFTLRPSLEYRKNNAFNDIWIHYYAGTENEDDEWVGGYIEIQFNDYYAKENLRTLFYRPNALEKSIFNVVTNELENIDETKQGVISNIMIADEIIDTNEKIISVPVTDIETDMINLGDGVYNSTVEDQYILQSVDANSLILQYGGKSEVKDIIIFGNPAYKTNNGLSTVTLIEKNNNTILEHESATLQAAESSYVMLEYEPESMTIKDLAGKAYGLKVGV